MQRWIVIRVGGLNGSFGPSGDGFCVFDTHLGGPPHSGYLTTTSKEMAERAADALNYSQIVAPPEASKEQ